MTAQCYERAASDGTLQASGGVTETHRQRHEEE